MFVVPETIEIVTDLFETVYNYPINLDLVRTFKNLYIEKDHHTNHHIIEFWFSVNHLEIWEFENEAECTREFRRLNALVVHESHWKK